MDHLESIVDALLPEHQKEFALHLQRQKSKQQRKDIELFRLLTERNNRSTKAKALPDTLYDNRPDRMAYHALRKRLMRQLADFILLKSREYDVSATAEITQLIALARYLFDRGVDKTAWSMLRKAEKNALRNEHFDLLNTIYHIQLEKSDSEFADPLDEIIQKRNQNKPLYDEEERAIIAQALITRQLNEAKMAGYTPDFESVVSETLAQYQLTAVVSQRPALLYKLIMMVRSTVLVRKDYHAFEPYIIAHYTHMQGSGALAPRYGYIQLRLLYMIAQTLYRNRKFGESLSYLAQVQHLLNTSQSAYFGQFYPRLVMLSAANYIYDNRREQAIGLLESLLRDYAKTLPIKDALNAQMNLAFYYFQEENYAKASRLLLTIPHSDQWCQKKMGIEWVLKKNLSELII